MYKEKYLKYKMKGGGINRNDLITPDELFNPNYEYLHPIYGLINFKCYI